MAYQHKAVIESQYEQLDAERAQALADYEAGRQREDALETMSAANRILDVDARRDALNRIAHKMTTQQQPPQGNAYGLSNDEIEVAKNSHGAGTVEDRIKEYAQNKQRYQHARATGQYRDDQGTVSR